MIRAILGAGLLALAVPAFAVDGGAVIGGAVGGAAGAAIGQKLDGKNGAIIGAAIGGATGAAVGSRSSKPETRVVEKRVVVRERDDDDRWRHDHGRHKGHHKHH